MLDGLSPEESSRHRRELHVSALGRKQPSITVFVDANRVAHSAAPDRYRPAGLREQPFGMMVTDFCQGEYGLDNKAHSLLQSGLKDSAQQVIHFATPAVLFAVWDGNIDGANVAELGGVRISTG